MADRLEYRVNDGIAVVSLALEPEGGAGRLDREAREEIVAALAAAERDPGVTALVITGQGRSFPGGLPEAEIARGEAAPTLRALCDRIEGLSKPVVAAMRGEVRDGGAELALACHARLAVVGTVLALGDIRRGLVPGAGATQRLPRLVGADGAMDLLFAGRALAADSRRLSGLFRRIVARNVTGEAVAAAREMLDEPPADRNEALAQPIEFQTAVEKRYQRGLPPEAEAMLECIEAAQILPLDAGLEMESALREELRQSARAQGLIRTVALETRPAPRLAAGEMPERITVLGDGMLAYRIGRMVLDAGFGLHLAEQRERGAAVLLQRMDEAYQAEAGQGRIPAAVAQARMARASGGPSPDFLGQAEFVIEACDAPDEAIPELARLIDRSVVPDAAVLLTSGMALGAGRLSGLLSGRVMGFVPGGAGGRLRLGELALGVAGQRAGAVAGAVLARCHLHLVACPPANGLIAARMKLALLAAAEWCVRHGAEPGEVDEALGWAQGPFHLADLEGLAPLGGLFAALGSGASGGLFAAFRKAGREGRQAGKGFFSYAQHGAEGDYDAGARAVVEGWRGMAPQGGPTPAAIRRRIWAALFSAGMDLLESGAARDAGDVDLAAIEALGLPRASGGPMKAGELRGLLTVRRELEDWGEAALEQWHGSARLTEMIKNGEGFRAAVNPA